MTCIDTSQEQHNKRLKRCYRKLWRANEGMIDEMVARTAKRRRRRQKPRKQNQKTDP